MRVDLLTREYPPEIYGGAGVHVAELVAAMRGEIDVTVRCFGEERGEANTFAYQVPSELAGANGALTTLGTDLLMAQDAAGADLVHSHTWYANGAGHLAKLLHGIPQASRAPMRPLPGSTLQKL